MANNHLRRQPDKVFRNKLRFKERILPALFLYCDRFKKKWGLSRISKSNEQRIQIKCDGSLIDQIGDPFDPVMRNEPAFLDTEDYIYEIHVMQKGAIVDMFKYY